MTKVPQDILDRAAKALCRTDPGILYRSDGQIDQTKLRQWETDRTHIADCFGLNHSTKSEERRAFYAACEAARGNR